MIIISSANVGEFVIHLRNDGLVLFPPAWYGDRTTNELPARVQFMDSYKRTDGPFFVRYLRDWLNLVEAAKQAVLH